MKSTAGLAIGLHAVVRTLDTGRIAAVSHSMLRPGFAASTLSPSDWRVQVAARSPGPTEARTNGITWLVSIGAAPRGRSEPTKRPPAREKTLQARLRLTARA